MALLRGLPASCAFALILMVMCTFATGTEAIHEESIVMNAKQAPTAVELCGKIPPNRVWDVQWSGNPSATVEYMNGFNTPYISGVGRLSVKPTDYFTLTKMTGTNYQLKQYGSDGSLKTTFPEGSVKSNPDVVFYIVDGWYGTAITKKKHKMWDSATFSNLQFNRSASFLQDACMQQACDDMSGPYISLAMDPRASRDGKRGNRIYVRQEGCKAVVFLGDGAWYSNGGQRDYIVAGNTIYMADVEYRYGFSVGVLQGPDSKNPGDIAFNGSGFDTTEGYWQRLGYCYDSPPEWKDFWGNGCDYYAKDFSRCRAVGLGKLATDACCACNGGSWGTSPESGEKLPAPPAVTCWKPLSCAAYRCPNNGAPWETMVTRKNNSVFCNGKLHSCVSYISTNSMDMHWSYDFQEACCDANSGCHDKNPNNSQAWYDSRGRHYTCNWYGLGDNCNKYGSMYRNFGYTANEACCTCGGTDACYDKMVRGVKWAPQYYSSGCDRYYGPSACAREGGDKNFLGQTGNESCCGCGGGATRAASGIDSVCVDLVPPGQEKYKSPTGRTCKQYEYDLVRNNGKCPDSLCGFIGMCPETACCICGGGHYVTVTTTTSTTTARCMGAVSCHTYGCPESHPYPKKGSVYCRPVSSKNPYRYQTNSERMEEELEIQKCPTNWCNHSKFCWENYNGYHGEGENYLETCCSKAPESSHFCFDKKELGTCSMYGCPKNYVNKTPSAAVLCVLASTYNGSQVLKKCNDATRYSHGQWQTIWSAPWALKACCEPEKKAKVVVQYELQRDIEGCDPRGEPFKWGESPNLSDCIWYASSNGYAYVEFRQSLGESFCYVSESCSAVWKGGGSDVYLISSMTTTTTTSGTALCLKGTPCSALKCPVGYSLVPDANSVTVPCGESSSYDIFQTCHYNYYYNHNSDLRCPDDEYYDRCWSRPFFNICCTNATTTKRGTRDEEKAAALLAHTPRTLSLAAAASISGAGVLMTLFFVKICRSPAPLNMQKPLIES